MTTWGRLEVAALTLERVAEEVATSLGGLALESGSPLNAETIQWSSANNQWEFVAPGAPAAHDIEGASHTLAGATAGEVMQATGATTFAFQPLKTDTIAEQTVGVGVTIDVLTLVKDGIIKGAFGSAAAPAVSFTGDPDAGFYRIGEGRIGFVPGSAVLLNEFEIISAQVGRMRFYRVDNALTANRLPHIAHNNALGTGILFDPNSHQGFGVDSMLFTFGASTPGTLCGAIGTGGLWTFITGAEFQAEVYADAEVDEGDSGAGNIDIDWTTGPFHEINATGDATIRMGTTAGVTPSGPTCLVLRVKYDGTAQRSFTWDALIRGESQITMPSAVNESTIVPLYFDGVNYWVGALTPFSA